MKAALQAAEMLEADHDAALEQWRLQVERASYEAQRAERRYRQVEPEHRLVARGLEHALAKLAEVEAQLERRQHARPRTLTPDERRQLLALGADIGRVWSAPTTTDRDRKQLLRCLIEEVIIDVSREDRRAKLTIRWRGGAITGLVVALKRYQPKLRTDEDTVDLLIRLAVHYRSDRSPRLTRPRPGEKHHPRSGGAGSSATRPTTHHGQRQLGGVSGHSSNQIGRGSVIDSVEDRLRGVQ